MRFLECIPLILAALFVIVALGGGPVLWTIATAIFGLLPPMGWFGLAAFIVLAIVHAIPS